MKTIAIPQNKQDRQAVVNSLAALYGVQNIPDASVLPVLEFTMLALNASADELKNFLKMTEH